jgi:hypothetical protein
MRIRNLGFGEEEGKRRVREYKFYGSQILREKDVRVNRLLILLSLGEGHGEIIRLRIEGIVAKGLYRRWIIECGGCRDCRDCRDRRRNTNRRKYRRTGGESKGFEN